jgi:hypothetical protein
MREMAALMKQKSPEAIRPGARKSTEKRTSNRRVKK